MIVFGDVRADPGPQRPGRQVFVDIDILGFQAAEPPLNHNIIYPTRLAVHTLSDALTPEKAGIFLACELATLIAVDNPRLAIDHYRFLYRHENGRRFQRIEWTKGRFP